MPILQAFHGTTLSRNISITVPHNIEKRCSEFKAFSLAEEIVRQVVKWGFGYFNIEKQKWRTFLDPIEEAARKAIAETIRRLAITELRAIIENCPEEDTRWQAAESLGKIAPGNPQRQSVVSALQPHLSDETYENNSHLFQNCYELL